MPENRSQPPQQQPWENGWAPDTSRAPGTRRLWAAGALALATIVVCVTAIVVTENETDEVSSTTRSAAPQTSVTVPGLISFATPSTPAATTPGGKNGASPSASTSASPEATPTRNSPTPSASATPTKSSGSGGGSSSAPESSASWVSLRSVNYPDRYWHLNDGYVRLDEIGSGPEQREDSTFQRVQGLADSSCYSFVTSDGAYLRHRSFVLVKNRNDGSSLFQQDATFCPRSSYSGAIMLESVNYPGRFLRHERFQLKLERYEYNGQYHADSAFWMVDGLA